MEEFPNNHQFIGFADDNKINIKEEINKYLLYWYWFIASVLVALIIAFTYLKYSTPLYSASSYIMVKDNLDAGISDELKAVADLGIVGNSSTNNPDNEVFIVTSRKIIGRVVDSLALNIGYFSEGILKKTEYYRDNAIKVQFSSKDSTFRHLNTSFIVTPLNEKKFLLKNSEGKIFDEFRFNEVIDSPDFGKFTVVRNNIPFDNKANLKDVIVVIRSRKNTIDTYKSKLSVQGVDKRSSVLNLRISDPIRLRAEHILDEVVHQYNLDALLDKNLVSIKTKYFIEERLASVGFELGIIQDNLKNYKTDFGIIGYSAENEIILESISLNIDKINQLTIQLSLIKWAKEEVAKQVLDNQVLPTNIGVDDVNTTNAIEEFNEFVLEKYRLERIAGVKNPSLITLNKKIEISKKNLLANLNNLQNAIEIQIENTKQEANKNQKDILRIPLIERGMIDIEREQIIYSELYSYLLKKKEELAISLAVTVPNAKIIDDAYGSDAPVSPNKNIIYLSAIIIGLLVPFGIIYLKISLDTKIHVRKDIESNLQIPFLGDIPNSDLKSRLIIEKSTRTSVAEAFRLLRTNINYMLPKRKNSIKGSLIFVTSTISGEGKSFISINLAASLALTNKKVLLIGMDLRAPKINNYLSIPDQKGITDYILDNELTLEDIKFTLPEIDGVDFVSSGLIPPNPSELLLDKCIKKLFKKVKKEYDYIIVDTAPVSLVTDTLLIASYADLFLYVVRANHLDKRMLIVPNTLYKENKLPNMAIVLNGTDSKRGYGYGYGYVENDQKSYHKKVFQL